MSRMMHTYYLAYSGVDHMNPARPISVLSNCFLEVPFEITSERHVLEVTRAVAEGTKMSTITVTGLIAFSKLNSREIVEDIVNEVVPEEQSKSGLILEGKWGKQ